MKAFSKQILVTVDTSGSAWTYALELIAELEASDIQVALATFGNPLCDEQKAAAAQLQNLQIYESGFRSDWMAESPQDFERAGQWLIQLEDQIKPDLIHFNHLSYAYLPFKAPKIVVAHSDVATWWKAVKKEPLPLKWRRYQVEVSRGIQAADCVIAPTRSYLQQLSKTYGLALRSAVIPYGRPSPFTPLRSCRELSLTEQAPRFLSAAVFCLPSQYEPFGLTVLEAALTGRALILSRIPSLEENWKGAALFVNPEDPAQITQAIEDVIQDQELRQNLVAKAQDRARFLGSKRMASHYLRIYQEFAKPSAYSVPHLNPRPAQDRILSI